MNNLLVCLSISLTLVSCQKEMSDTANQRPATVDDAGSGLLIKSVEVWNSQDSLVTQYAYDSDKRLISATSLTGWGYIKYSRDADGRITKIEKKSKSADIGFTYVFYADNTNKVSYSISESSSAPNLRDSAVYFYNGDKVLKTESYNLESNVFVKNSFNEWSYNADGNLSNLKVFVRNGSGNIVPNISYDFEYDDKVNPFYAPDDARLIENWYMVASANNLIKQINHYDNSGLPDDHIILGYEYGNSNKPFKGQRSGPAIGTSIVASTFFYE